MSDRAEYDRDFFLWTRQQARILREATRAGVNVPADWQNLSGEIETLGTSQRRELGSRVGIIIEHLLKLQSSRAIRPRLGWQASIERERGEIELLLEESPSLRHDLPELITRRMRLARRLAATDLRLYREELAEVADYSAEQILGDWLPPSED